MKDVPFFASKVTLGKDGVETIHGRGLTLVHPSA